MCLREKFPCATVSECPACGPKNCHFRRVPGDSSEYSELSSELRWLISTAHLPMMRIQQGLIREPAEKAEMDEKPLVKLITEMLARESLRTSRELEEIRSLLTETVGMEERIDDCAYYIGELRVRLDEQEQDMYSHVEAVIEKEVSDEVADVREKLWHVKKTVKNLAAEAPIDAKIRRRSKMVGSTMERVLGFTEAMNAALEEMKANAEAMKVQQDASLAAMKAQHDATLNAMKAQHDATLNKGVALIPRKRKHNENDSGEGSDDESKK